ncbi:unnamed protein product [Notodromas monacha]|uniref:Uncharacterized protein n=1 Tax=Notodromas monacha TaxID=399045 RepID=A0A7R9C295_9CRUS|nr:unnamed protein product [Notodromas monacha]CAD7284945.1 unnamed protein product [Notodromas monacha]CAG0925096.1 unnamed protein product [Notodromas monacha]CAG0925097.1 unnamed protein product [Notodromas monacha]
MAAIPSHRVSRKIDFCGPVQPSVMMHHHHHHLHHNHQHNHLQNRKRGVHLLLRSGGSAGAGNPGSTFVVTKPTVMKPVGNSLVLSPKEPPPDTILLSPQQM